MSRRSRSLPAAIAWFLGAACVPAADDPDSVPEEGELPVPFLDLDPANLEQDLPDPDSTAVRVGVFVGVDSEIWRSSSVDEADARSLVEAMVQDADDVLRQCSLHLEIEAAQVLGLPLELMDIEGNNEGSFGGHPPEGTPDPERFNYDQGERLTASTRELFAYGKRFTDPNAISAFTVRRIDYWTQEGRTPAGGLSFSPNSYHHPDDHPLRNSVLLAPRYRSFSPLPSPPDPEVLAHELAHMLLNSGLHDQAPENLMGGGDELRPAQCSRMLEELDRLFGEDSVPDPGRP